MSEASYPAASPTTKFNATLEEENSNFNVKQVTHDVVLIPVVRVRNALHLDLLAMFGEFVGTFLFLYMAFTSAQSGVYSSTQDLNKPTSSVKDNQALSFGMSLLVNAWVFFRITGAAFNPAVSFALWLIGGVSNRRLVMIVPAQMAGGACAAALAKLLTLGEFGVENSLAPGISVVQGLFIEMVTTALLCFTVLMCAAEKSKGAFLAPVAIGLALFIGHLSSIGWTGAGINPARTFGPSVANRNFESYTWLYYAGQMLGSVVATGVYVIFKHFDYQQVAGFIEDDDHAASANLGTAPLFKAVGYRSEV
ncbi:hypothetical protein RQP46_007388 [Phenoliferia psychrophenolica]